MFKNFTLDQVVLEDRYFKMRSELVKKYITDFDIDRLMHTFRKNAGIESTAEPLGGWEAETVEVRGHFVGHFLSACSKFAYGTQDDFLKNKADAIVDIMEACARPNGYLSAFDESALDTLEFEENRNVWAPYYTLHKILQGLIDSYNYTGNSKALRLAVNLTGYIRQRFDKLSYWKIDGILRCTKVNPVNEFGGIGDAIYSLYEITKDNKILELANLFDREYFIGKLASGCDVLENLHANTHLPMINASLHRHQVTNEVLYKTAAVNFYEYLMGRTFANGNNSSKATAFIKGGVSEKSEHWGGYNRLDDALTGGESESCCAHNTEKIAQGLFIDCGEIQFLDHVEVLKYNAVLNSASSRTGLSQYHQPMGVEAVKKFSSLYDHFWCCTGSGVEAMSELQKNIWFCDENTLLLNMFVASTVGWKEMGAVITQKTEYPDKLTSVLSIRLDKPVKFRFMFKKAGIKCIRINGEVQDLQVTEGFVTIYRVFEDNDELVIDIAETLRLVPLLGSSDRVAIMAGNVLLAQRGQYGNMKDLTNENIQDRLTRTQADSLVFSAVDDDGNPMEFVPLFQVEDETYTVYRYLGKSDFVKDGFSVAKDGSEAYG